MVAYNFQSWSAPLVESGEKGHTIRAPRRNRHAQPGDRLQLFTGQRTVNCRKLVVPDPVCWQIFGIQIEPWLSGMCRKPGPAVIIHGKTLEPEELELLAIGDGFPSVSALFEFFPKPLPIGQERYLICWQEKDWLKRFL